jgi:predicted transcriptional regulator
MKQATIPRKETKKFIDQADEKTVKMIHAMLEAEQEMDWYDELTEDAKASIERGLKDAAKGRTLTHKEVMKKYQKWRLK